MTLKPEFQKETLNMPDEKFMQNMGLPSNFANRPGEDIDAGDYKIENALPPNLFTGAVSFQEQQTVRKGQKETFYCELCMIELNSRDTLYSHIKGQKHIRKEEDHKADINRARRRGYTIEEKKVIPIAN